MTQFVYLSNALSGTISRYRLKRGELTLIGETEVGEMVMPMTVSHCQQYLYAAVRTNPYRLVQFRIDQLTGDLTLRSDCEVEESIVSLDIDLHNQQLLAASFNQNRVIVKALDESGRISESTTAFQHQSHCHMFRYSPDEKWTVATVFGQDKLYIYSASSCHGVSKAPVFAYDFETDSGPRHFDFSPCGKFLYVLTEMSATVYTFAFDSVNGSLKLIDQTSVLPLKALGLEKGLPPAQRVDNDVPRAWAADIHITANGRYLYVSERTLSVMACLEISCDDHLPRYLNYYPVEQQPRSFIITEGGQYMLVSGELASELGLYSICSDSGAIERVSSAQCGEGAAWVCVANCM